MTKIKTTLALLGCLAASLSLPAQEIGGKWYGYPDLKTMRMRMEYDLTAEGDAYAATLFLPDLGGKRYRATEVTREGNALRIDIPDAQTACVLEVRGADTLRGTLRWEGYDFPLTLTRTPVVFNRPQTPQAPFPYRSEEVTFPNGEEQVTLAGTLTLPKGERPCKAVVLISGSGAQDRDGTHSEHLMFGVLADHLTRAGIAVLRTDDRGVGRSQGNASTAALPEAISDARAAIAYLKQRPEILADSIGVIGHSEGAFAAFTLAALKEVPFLVTLGGGGINGRELLLMQRAALLRASGAKEEFISNYNEYMRKAQDVVLQTADAATCQRQLAAVFAGSPLAGQEASITQQLYNPAKIELLKYDPEWDFPEITCPVLALNGGKDCQVPVGNLEYIRRGITANGNPHVTVKAYPALNHMFQTAGTGLPVEYSDIEETFSPEALADIARWLNRFSL